MGFLTRFIKRKSPLLDAQDTPADAGVFKRFLQILVRQKQFWFALGLTMLILGAGTYWLLNVQPYLKEKIIGAHMPEAPAATNEPSNVAEDTHPTGLTDIQESVREARAEAVSLMRQAEIHYQQGVVDSAKDKLKQAITLTSDTGLLSTAYANLANILDGEGRYTEAERFLQRALTFNRHFIDGFHNLGVVYLHMRDFDKSQLAFQMALRERGDFAPSHAGLGEIHSIQGRYPEAIQSFTESLRLREDPGVRLNLGLAYLQSGNHAMAMEQFAVVISSTSDPYLRYIAHFNRGFVLDSKGRYDEAVSDYQTAISLAPKDIDATFNLGLSLMAAGRKEEGIQAFRGVIQYDPNNLDAYLNAVTMHSDLGQYQAAYDLLRPVHDRIPYHRRVNYLLGHLCHRLGKLGESHEFFNKVLLSGRDELQPQLKADALAGLASVFDDSGDLGAAETYYNEALLLDKSSYLHYNLSRTYRRDRKYEDSIRTITAAVDQEPGNYTYVLAQAEVLFEADYLAKAYDVYKLAAELSPHESYPRFMMAYTASRQRMWPAALTEFNRLLSNPVPQEVRGAVLKGIGNVYHDQGEYEKALDAYRDAAGALTGDASLYYNIARTYFQMNRYDECYSALQKSISLNPNSTESHTLLGTYYFKKGLMDRAYAEFEEAVRLNPENLEAYYNRDVVRKLR